MVGINLIAEFDPNLSTLINQLEKSDRKTFENVDNALRIAALNLNKDLKNANPANTGHSRRGWGAPRRIDKASWLVSNKVNYVPYIKYGITKPSRYVGSPKGVTIRGGKPFKEVIEQSFDAILSGLEKNIGKIVEEYFA